MCNIEDKLKIEYVDLEDKLYQLMKKVEFRYTNILEELLFNEEKYKKIEICSRVKTCLSSIASLRRRQEGGEFDDNIKYSILDLKDVIGVRIAVFPHDLLKIIDEKVKNNIGNNLTKEDHDDEFKIFKYYYNEDNISVEIQVVPILISKFWDVEHSVYYKPDFRVAHVSASLVMKYACYLV
ncbi:TPA: hypothetical protein NHH99_001086 [Legionella pneumophila]|nr:hypothetical protein [Legionella pneumophila]HCE5494701.1 hypothetical protein [Legionella pneumophila]